MRILVTGAAGFIGYHLCERLLARGDEVVGLDSLNSYYDPALKLARLSLLEKKKGFRFVRGDIADRTLLEGSKPPVGSSYDRVCNLAAQAGVRYSLENPRAYIEANIVGFINVLEYCREAKTPHLLYASSSSVYGLNASRPFNVEDRTDRPASIYAATKKADELMAHTYSHLYGLPTTGLRFFTVYGPWGRPDMAYYKFAEAISRGEPIDVYNEGRLLRDFTYIDDIVDGVVRALDAVPSPAESVPYRLYNIGNSKAEPLGRFIEVLEKALGKAAEKRYLPMQNGDVYATEADVSAMEADFGWKPSIDIDEGLARFAAWYRSYKMGM